MTLHIKNKIEQILFQGGYVVKNLKTLIDVLEDIRSKESIEREFQQAFKDIEQRKGTIMKSTKEDVYKYINCTEKYNFENQYNAEKTKL